MDKEYVIKSQADLLAMFQELGWRVWDLRTDPTPLDASQFEPRVGRFVQQVQSILEPPYGISIVEDYTAKPRDNKMLTSLVICKRKPVQERERYVDVAQVFVDVNQKVGFYDFTEGKKLEAKLQGLKFE